MLVSFTYASLLVRVRGALAAVDMVNSTQVLPTVEPVSALCEFATDGDSIYTFGGIGCGLMMLIMLSQNRVSLWPSVLGGRPGLVIPVNLLEGRSNRFSYIAAFCAMVGALINLVFNAIAFTGSEPWTQTLRAIALVFLISISYAVIVTGIDAPVKLVGYTIGLVYSIVIISVNSAIVVQCNNGIFGIAPTVLSQLPSLFLLYLICWYAYKLVKELCTITQKGSGLPLDQHRVPIEWKYVKQRMCRKLDDTSGLPSTWYARFINGIRYHWDPTFRYSTRMLVTTSIAAVALWELAVASFATGIHLHGSIHDLADSLKSATSNAGPNNSVKVYYDNLVDFIADSIPDSYLTAVTLTTLITAAHLLHILACYRKHMKRLYRGDRSFLPRAQPQPVGLMTASMRYSGYQIGYMLWGFVLQSFVFFLVFLVIEFLFFFDIVSFGDLVLQFLPTIVFTILLFIAQFLLAKYVLLTDYGKYVNISNRRLFHSISFFSFFYNALIGLFSCLRRILTGLVLGLLLIDRLDRCTLPNGWEGFDPGYRSYVGYLLLEHSYSNPYLVTFLYLLRRKDCSRATVDEVELYGVHSNTSQFLSYRSRITRNRWLVAYTLINNPSLLKYRDHRVDKLEHAMLLTRSFSLSHDATQSRSTEKLVTTAEDELA
ncbi:stimulated by retinoic acid gene 6 protein-like [Corticium candelabrum]|uniref:stimulated by retinoic acid gene 6 protein-like n=1 Tax=Corticium candelabrum TaxID=121492 RepID=UPI002E268A80|nr:stimulated by retinoic acid gene 6 protein-like [Corticium candelabrum]